MNTTRRRRFQRIAALDTHQLITPDGGAPRSADEALPIRPTVYDLAALGLDLDLDQLWLCADWCRARGLLDEQTAEEMMAEDHVPLGFLTPGRPGYARHGAVDGAWIGVTHAASGRSIDVVLTPLLTSTPWPDAGDAAELHCALQLYHNSVGTAYWRTAARTGVSLMFDLAPRGLLQQEYEQCPVSHNEPDGWQWMRPLTADEASRRYIHGYDKSAMYLAACSSVDLGTGAWMHDETGDRTASGTAPGYYRVVVDWPDGRRPSDGLLPNPVVGRPDQEGRPGLWMTSPTVRLAARLGAAIHVQESWAQPGRIRALEAWYHRLRAARASLMGITGDDLVPARLAFAAVKQTYAGGIGRLGSSFARNAPGGDPSPFYRPEWRHHIIAQARANLYYNLLALEGDGASVFAVDTDAIYVTSDEPNAWIPAGWDEGERPSGRWLTEHAGVAPGAWRHLGTVDLADAREVGALVGPAPRAIREFVTRHGHR